jgi:hypothetical protein
MRSISFLGALFIMRYKADFVVSTENRGYPFLPSSAVLIRDTWICFLET